MVEIEFGTGAVKITPAHDHNDYDCGKRHNLAFIEMMDDEGNITDVCEQFKVGVASHMTTKQIILVQIHMTFLIKKKVM